MFSRITLSLLFLIFTSSVVGNYMIAEDTDIYAVTNCDGTQVVRVALGKFEVRYVEKNMPGCTGKKELTFNSDESTGSVDASEAVVVSEKINCSGLKITSLSSGRHFSTEVEKNLPGCIVAKYNTKIRPESPRINTGSGPLLDLASTDIVNYRAKQLKDQNIRFANAIRSVRMRNAATKASKTNAYLIKNDAVVISGKETGWVKTTGANIEVTDTHENTVTAFTGGKASGFVAKSFLRDPNASDLVRILQADQAYWSDLASTKVAHMVNVRFHPWYTAPIVTTLRNNVSLFVVSTVDNWSEVKNDDDTLHGFIRSDFLHINKSQRVDK